MPNLYTCTCKSHSHKNKQVDYNTKQIHYCTDLHLQMLASQVIHRGLVVPHVPSDPAPLKPPYPPRDPHVPPKLEFPHTCSLEPFFKGIDHCEAHSPEPLNTYETDLPPNPEEHNVQHGMEWLLEEIQRQQAILDATEQDEEIPNVDFGSNDPLDLPDEATYQSISEDSPDPFQTDVDLQQTNFLTTGNWFIKSHSVSQSVSAVLSLKLDSKLLSKSVHPVLSVKPEDLCNRQIIIHQLIRAVRLISDSGHNLAEQSDYKLLKT
ncbi:hypothetical protein EDC04DRAFT_2601289 [Pisolithus marmoratus]|nr:hypothetical protein EDC04DRAFT_2601289 [Pisolithus marmoratus]